MLRHFWEFLLSAILALLTPKHPLLLVALFLLAVIDTLVGASMAALHGEFKARTFGRAAQKLVKFAIVVLSANIIVVAFPSADWLEVGAIFFLCFEEFFSITEKLSNDAINRMGAALKKYAKDRYGDLPTVGAPDDPTDTEE